jgi:sulfur carrier protein
LITIKINGITRQFPDPTNLASLVKELGLTGKRFALELNGEIVPHSSISNLHLAEGDILEVVIAVGGG